MTELHRHRGHRIELELFEIEPGRYRWAFVIDGSGLTAGSSTLHALAMAREDALMIARLAVENLLRDGASLSH